MQPDVGSQTRFIDEEDVTDRLAGEEVIRYRRQRTNGMKALTETYDLLSGNGDQSQVCDAVSKQNYYIF